MRSDETVPEGLTGDAALIAALASGKRVEDAAREAGCSRATVYRRLQDLAFRRLVADQRSIVPDRSAGLLAEVAVAAVVALARLLGKAMPGSGYMPPAPSSTTP